MTAARRPAFILLGMCSMVILFQKLHTRTEPLECDTALFSVLAQEWRQGRPMYSDLWDNKPPGLVLAYAAAQAVARSSAGAILLLEVGISVLTLLGIFFGASGMMRDQRAGFWAAIFWTLASATPHLEANFPLAEVFVNLSWAWAMAFLFRANNNDSPRQDVWIAGSFLALASFFKHHLVISNVLLTLGFALVRSFKSRLSRQALTGEILRVLLPSLILWVFAFAYFFCTHRFLIFWNTLTTYSYSYAQSQGADGILWNLVHSCAPSALSSASQRGVFSALVPMALAGFPGILVGLRTRNSSWNLAIVYGIAAWVGMAIPGRNYAHYYQLLLPPLAIMAGAAACLSLDTVRSTSAAWMPTLWAGGMALILLFRELPFYRLDATQWSRLEYGDVYLTVKKMGEEIGKNLAPGEAFYEIGYEPGLYYYSRRRPPTGILLADHWEAGPAHELFSKRIMHDLAEHRPELLVTTRFWLADPRHRLQPVLQWCLERYRPLPDALNVGPFLLAARRGGSLEARLLLEGSSLSQKASPDTP